MNENHYNYGYVELEEVMENPREFIIPECLPACRACWNKNIETFMVSNYEDDHLYVLFNKLSEENESIIRNLMETDSRYFYDEFRKTYGIKVNGRTQADIIELMDLTGALAVQDTTRYRKAEDFLDEIKRKGGEMVVQPDGTIVTELNPKLANLTLEQALKITGKSSLYIKEEGLIYDNPIFLLWHQKYLKNVVLKKQAKLVKEHEDQEKDEYIKEELDYIASNKENIDAEIAYFRDTFLQAERDYVGALLQQDAYRDWIQKYNEMPVDLLFKAAQQIVADVENGLVSDDMMDEAEIRLFVILSSIRDKSLIKELRIPFTR